MKESSYLLTPKEANRLYNMTVLLLVLALVFPGMVFLLLDLISMNPPDVIWLSAVALLVSAAFVRNAIPALLIMRRTVVFHRKEEGQYECILTGGKSIFCMNLEDRIQALNVRIENPLLQKFFPKDIPVRFMLIEGKKYYVCESSKKKE